MSLLMELKTFVKLRAGEIASWNESKWRSIVPYNQNVWHPWHSAASKVYELMAKRVYPRGNSVLTIVETQGFVLKHNRKMGVNKEQV